MLSAPARDEGVAMRTCRIVHAIIALGCFMALWEAVGAEEPVPVVEVCEVLTNLEKYAGKEIILIGASRRSSEVFNVGGGVFVIDQTCDLGPEGTLFRPTIAVGAADYTGPLWRPPAVAEAVLQRLLAGNPDCNMVAVWGHIEVNNDPHFWVDYGGARWPREQVRRDEPARIRSNPVIFVIAIPPEVDRAACTSGDGYVMRERYELAEAGVFDEESLREHFAGLAAKPLNGEILAIATPDRPVQERLSGPWRPALPGEKSWFEIADLSLPLAYCFKFGEDTFLQYRDRQGNIGWLLLSGRNLFAEALDGNQFVLVGYEPITGSFGPCEDNRRTLTFVVPAMTRERALAAARFFHERLPQPSGLSVNFFTSMEDALRLTSLRFPGLELLSDFRAEMERRRTTKEPPTDEEYLEEERYLEGEEYFEQYFDQVTSHPMRGKHWSFYRGWGPGICWFTVYEGPGDFWREKID
jgi:hypothetical protein